jgi:hypothetical protein
MIKSQFFMIERILVDNEFFVMIEKTVRGKP